MSTHHGAASAEQAAVSADFDYSIVDRTAHRPWPMPRRPWLMTQSWHDLLFAHWRVDVSEVRRAVPAAFDLDLFDDEAWLGIVPFHMTNVGLRATPTVPWISAFPELNVRTYVRVADRPGVYFFSLDAARGLAVAAARALLNLPYYTADMRLERRGDGLDYESARRTREHARVQGDVRTCRRPVRPERRFDRGTSSRSGTASTITTARAVHTASRSTTGRGPSRPHARRSRMNTMAAASHLTLNGAPALLHFARRQDVVAWAPTRLSDGRHRSVRNVTE